MSKKELEVLMDELDEAMTNTMILMKIKLITPEQASAIYKPINRVWNQLRNMMAKEISFNYGG